MIRPKGTECPVISDGYHSSAFYSAHIPCEACQPEAFRIHTEQFSAEVLAALRQIHSKVVGIDDRVAVDVAAISGPVLVKMGLFKPWKPTVLEATS